MPEDQQIPPSVDQSEDRIKERDYSSDFARFPEDETHPVTDMGGGPRGPVATTNGPIILMAIGGITAFLVFAFNSPWVLVLGLAIFVGGAMWAGIASRGDPGRGASTATSDDEG